LTLLFPERTEILDALAMVGTSHAHNLFDVLGVSQDPLGISIEHLVCIPFLEPYRVVNLTLPCLVMST
jgi:hypothetical protein